MISSPQIEGWVRNKKTANKVARQLIAVFGVGGVAHAIDQPRIRTKPPLTLKDHAMCRQDPSDLARSPILSIVFSQPASDRACEGPI